MKRIITALLAGLVFGAGLALSGMADPQKVLAFLDLGAIATGGWDPSLAFVMGGGLIVTLPGFAYARRRSRPVVAEEFAWPTASAIDKRLMAGAILFGIGWGLAGICPGPALTLLALDGTAAIIFFGAMLAGMIVYAAQKQIGR
ncbi:DUF6691 family protein [Dongia mobilis]|jgi:uncharacterized membrane protein YedE/YeeE|uniref:DUF6691 family protein n=1 Tax=Dongia sp. TaxID=1977262 RepID=UPI0026F008F9